MGKIYTAIGALISQEIFNLLELQTYVYLTSQMGRSLSDPWSVYVEICNANVTPSQQQFVEEIVERNFAKANETTQKIVNGELNLY